MRASQSKRYRAKEMRQQILLKHSKIGINSVRKRRKGKKRR